MAVDDAEFVGYPEHIALDGDYAVVAQFIYGETILFLLAADKFLEVFLHRLGVDESSHTGNILRISGENHDSIEIDTLGVGQILVDNLQRSRAGLPLDSIADLVGEHNLAVVDTATGILDDLLRIEFDNKHSR